MGIRKRRGRRKGRGRISGKEEGKENEEGKGRLRKEAQGMNFSSRKIKKEKRRRHLYEK
jgi:hypothetical protein